MGKDKKMIWDDCAQCAYKHLAAAYAEVTELGVADKALWTDGEAILVARAVIALSEVRAGYEGNIDIAVGCLAAAETRADSTYGGMYRKARMLLHEGKTVEAVESLVKPIEGWAEAHITEAIREFEELYNDGRPNLLGMTYEETAEWLKRKLKYLRETFEIGKELKNESDK